MKKVLLIILIVLTLSGCNKVDKDIQISELKYNDWWKKYCQFN